MPVVPNSHTPPEVTVIAQGTRGPSEYLRMTITTQWRMLMSCTSFAANLRYVLSAVLLTLLLASPTPAGELLAPASAKADGTVLYYSAQDIGVEGKGWAE